MKRIVVDGLPDDPLAASGVFHQHWLAHVEATLGQGEDVMLQLPAADHTHGEWRCAIVAGLGTQARTGSRQSRRRRGRGAGCQRTYLAAAPGVTGQYLEV